MVRTLYFECYSGISGDMSTAALLDLGADRDVLDRALSSLNVNGFRTEIGRVSKSGLDCCDFSVILDEDNHDHDHGYLYGDGKGHHHDHGDHRNPDDIIRIIEGADISENARSIAIRIVDVLAEAEAQAHGVPREKVHFHEVGAIDSIVDIVSFAVCLDNLGIDRIHFSELYEGTGCVRCQHGILPIPVPAVANIVRTHGLRLKITESQGEYVTPTGAAIAAAVGNVPTLPGSYRIVEIGMGAGKRESERSGILRAMILESEDVENDRVVKLECNIDDCTGEMMGHVMDVLMKAGARDVSFIPMFMKKNRPAYLMTVLCIDEDVGAMEDIIFRETTTIGIRRSVMDRTVMKRSFEELETPLGTVRVKVCRHGDIVKRYPEYDDLVRICEEKGMPFPEVDGIVSALIRNEP